MYVIFRDIKNFIHFKKIEKIMIEFFLKMNL